MTVAAPAVGGDRSNVVGEVGWAAGSLATGTVSNAISLYALFFLTTVVGIEAAIAGALILVSKLYDGISDPIMGAISDNTRHRLGPRRPYLVMGGLLTGAAFALFFSLGMIGINAGVVTVLISLLLLSTAYTIFSVPYLAMPPDIVPSYDGRTRLMSFRVLFMMCGVLLGSAGAPALIQAFGRDADGYAILGLALGVVVALGAIIAFFATSRFKVPPLPPKMEKLPIGQLALKPFRDVVAVFGNAPFRVLTLVKLLQLAVLSVALACTPYFFTYVLGMEQIGISYYLLVFTFAGLSSIPVWRYVIRRVGKKQAYLGLLASYGLAMLSWLFWQPGEPQFILYGRAIWIGVSSTGTLLCALALLPDTMEYDRLASGKSREGIMSGVFTLVEKLASALGPFIIGVLLQTMGLVAARGPDVVQPESALFAVKLGMSVVPAVLTLSCIPVLMYYRLDETALEKARATSKASPS